MRNTAARALLRPGLARHELRKVYDVVRPTLVVNSYNSTPPCLLQPVVAAPSTPRPFHTTSRAYKGKGKLRQPGWNDIKGKKQEIRAQLAEAVTTSRGGDGDANGSDAHNGPKHPPANPEEPLDFADVASRMGPHDEHFREALKKLKSGGRFNPDVVGNLRVQPDRKKPGLTYPLREVAQVIPQGGRTISIIAHEEAYVKPILSAVQASPDFNQQPQRDPDNELELSLKIEPEKRDDLLKRVKDMCLDWRDRVRSVRHRRDKQHVAWRKEGLLGPDMKRKADAELDKIIKAKMTEIDAAEKEALKDAQTK
ncbi:ribosome recycling factor [Hypoxylon fuscum]|nr:ribosome recycling factor [Hypoxylon fuscum]